MTENEIKSKISSETPRVRKTTLANCQNIPEEFQTIRQWMVYRFDQREAKKEPGGYSPKLGKPPVSPSSGNPVSWTDPKNFLSFDQAVNALKANKPGNLAGIGLVFTGEEPFSGVDIDSCVFQGSMDSKTGNIISRLNSYTEVSPSETGLRIIGRGKLPDGDKGGKYGNYEAYSEARFLTMTGVVFGQKRAIREFASDLAWFRKTYATKPEGPAQAGNASSSRGQQETRQQAGPLSDQDILAIIGKAKNASKIQDLMSGGGDSEGDAALIWELAFYTKDGAQIERLMRSTNRTREKWDEKRGDKSFLAYEIGRCLEKYKGGSYEPTEKTPLPCPQPGQDPRLLYNPNRTTDMGNAERLVEIAGANIRYVRDLGWFIWSGGRWIQDEALVRELFKEKVVHQLYQESAAKAHAHDSAGVKELSSWARRSEQEKQVNGALSMASSTQGIYIQASDLDRDPWLLNVANGTIDLKTGVLKAHERKNLITKLSPVNYDPTATAPTWEMFLTKIMNGNTNLIGFLQRAIGYSLTGNIDAQCWFIMYGVGANGKGTFINTILRILGDYATQAAPDLLMRAKGDMSKHPTEQADLFGRRLAVCQETEEGRRLAEVAVKQMTGGDRIKARHMRQDFFEFEPTHKLWLATNHKPVVGDTTESTWRRIRMIPFSVVIPETERDEDLPQKLFAELPGILAWSVRGCLEWQAQKLNPPQEVKAATDSYRQSQDILAEFLAERCHMPKNHPWALKTSAMRLYKAYSEWCEAYGEKPNSQRRFGEALTERGFRKIRGGTGAYVYEGIGLLTSEPSEPSEPLSGITSKNTSHEELMSESGSDYSEGSDERGSM